MQQCIHIVDQRTRACRISLTFRDGAFRYHAEMATLIAEAPVGTEDLDAEHALQYKLLSEVERLLAEENEAAARDVIRRLYDYSEAHFASEQVLMRLHSYPE